AVVAGGSNASGTYSVTIRNSQSTPKGLPIILTTKTPITIGGDSNIETVTPTSVVNDGQGNFIITAAFSNAHGIGDPVYSATGGLQEAATYMASKGGGLVALTMPWINSYAGGHANLATYLGGFDSVNTDVCLLDYSGITNAVSYTAATGSAYAATTNKLY